MHAVKSWVRPGEHDGMRGKGYRNGGVRTLKPHTIPCQRIQIWSMCNLVPVAPQMIGTKGVDGNENNVQLGSIRRSRHWRQESQTCEQRSKTAKKHGERKLYPSKKMLWLERSELI